MTREEAHELLRKFRLGLCTPAEADLVNQWYERMEDKNVTALEYEVNFEDLKNEMFEAINTNIDSKEIKERPLYLNYIWKAAAVIVIAIGIAFVFYSTRENNQSELPAVAIHHDIIQPVATDGKITLSDGTVVWVKPGSKLAYPQQFTGNERVVTLTGEAFFDVKRDPSKPFIIHAGKMTTKVLGTSFNIKAYENDKASEVTVVTGKVSVFLEGQNSGKISHVILEPNQKVKYLRELNELVRYEERNAQRLKLVAENALNFNEATLEEILSKVSVAYSIKVRYENDGIKKCIITADLSDQSLESSLQILTRSIGAKYIILQDEVVVSGKGCQ